MDYDRRHRKFAVVFRSSCTFVLSLLMTLIPGAVRFPRNNNIHYISFQRRELLSNDAITLHPAICIMFTSLPLTLRSLPHLSLHPASPSCLHPVNGLHHSPHCKQRDLPKTVCGQSDGISSGVGEWRGGGSRQICDQFFLTHIPCRRPTGTLAIRAGKRTSDHPLRQ